MEEIDVSIPILIAMVFISLFVAGMVFDRHDEKSVSDNLIGYVVYNKSEVTAKQLEGKFVTRFCIMVTKEKYKCEYWQLVNCKNGRCDIVVYNGNVIPDELLYHNSSHTIFIEEVGDEK